MLMSCPLSTAPMRGLTRNSVVTGQSFGPEFHGGSKGLFKMGRFCAGL